LFLKSCILLIFLTLFGLGLLIKKKKNWTVVGLALSFENSGLDLDGKI